MSARLEVDLAEVQRANTDLQRRLAEALAERDEAEAQKAAIAEILEVINSASGNPAPVFNAMIQKAMTLCGASFGELRTYDGERFLLVATHGCPHLIPSITAVTIPAIMDPALVRLVSWLVSA